MGLWPLTLCVFAACVVYLDCRPTPGRAMLAGCLLGFGQFTVSLWWISEAFTFQDQMPIWLGAGAVLLLCSYLALFPALALGLASRFWTRHPSRILVLAAFWTAGEWLRGHLFTGFPWNMVGQIWFDTPAVLQFARHTGAYGLSFITVVLFASVALWRERSWLSRAWAGLCMLVGALVLLDGLFVLRAARVSPVEGPMVHLIQANIEQDLEFDAARQTDILLRYEQMMAALPSSAEPGIVIWPETALEFDVAQDARLRTRLGALLGRHPLLILGAPRLDKESAGTNRAYNGLLVIDRAGQLVASYDKSRLVPFGEYLPGAGLFSWFGLEALAASAHRFTPGAGAAVLAPPGAPPFAPSICYEIIFARSLVPSDQRPQWVLNISNDAWFGRSWGPHQHFAQARLRAVEEGLPVVRSTPTGVSGVIDSYGRVVAKSGLAEPAILSARIPAPQPPTLYSRMGDAPVLLVLAAILLGPGYPRAFRAHGDMLLAIVLLPSTALAHDFFLLPSTDIGSGSASLTIQASVGSSFPATENVVTPDRVDLVSAHGAGSPKLAIAGAGATALNLKLTGLGSGTVVAAVTTKARDVEYGEDRIPLILSEYRVSKEALQSVAELAKPRTLKATSRHFAKTLVCVRSCEDRSAAEKPLDYPLEFVATAYAPGRFRVLASGRPLGGYPVDVVTETGERRHLNTNSAGEIEVPADARGPMMFFAAVLTPPSGSERYILDLSTLTFVQH
jgi:apolipoprotein N-acyltransferase